MKVCVLVSGGLDSTITYFVLKQERPDDEIIPVFIDLSQSYKDKELAACETIYGDELRILQVDSPKQDDKENYFIPNRNLFLASYATLVFCPDEIYLGGLADDNQVDKTPEIFEEMSALITKTSDKAIKVHSILWDYTKGRSVEMFLNKEIKDAEQLLLQSVSCYDGSTPNHCNDCAACYRRYVALASNNIEVVKPTQRIIAQYQDKVSEGSYHGDRIDRMASLGLLR